MSAERKPSAEESAAIKDWLADINDMFAGAGAHEGHTLRQVGRCVYCSCGKRVQGTLPKGSK